MRNLYLERAKSSLRNLLRHEADPEKRDDIRAIIDDINSGMITNDKWIQAAKMIGLRNPFFDGDEIGYPEDDFDE